MHFIVVLVYVGHVGRSIPYWVISERIALKFLVLKVKVIFISFQLTVLNRDTTIPLHRSVK